MNLKRSIFSALTTLAMLKSASADPIITFNEFWKRFENKSDKISAIKADIDSNTIARDRMARHWYPSIFLEAKSFYTDDPGLSLFSKLGERNMSGADFSPTVMNFPNKDRHEKVTLGAFLELYAGGAREKQKDSMEFVVQAKENQLYAVKTAEYSKAMGFYGNLIVLNKKKQSLAPIKSLIEKSIQNYRIGEKSNQLGYSGLLGLKNLQNRLNGEMKMLEDQRKAILLALKEYADLPSSWDTETTTLDQFISKNASVESKLKSTDDSYSVLAQKLQSQALDKIADGEYSKFLPQIGLFGQSDFYNNTDTTSSSSQTFGVYLKWELFTAPNFGAVKQARLAAKAAEKQALSTSKEQTASLQINATVSSALVEQIKLADQSLSFLEEQSKITKNLFTNGMINALQLTEVYGRQVDVISARTQMEEKLLQMSVESINYVKFNFDKE